MTIATVNKIIPFSSVDGPGNRTAVFLQGCDFDCRYCHNPETISMCTGCGICVTYCKTGAIRKEGGRVAFDASKCVQCDECIHHCPYTSCPRTRKMTAEEVMAEVRKNRPFIRGVTVSGGECTMQRDFLVEFLTLAKAEGLHTLLDSNGSCRLYLDPELMAVTDGVMLDIKAWDDHEHMAVTGYSNWRVLRNLEWLTAEKKLPEVRTVIVPELFDCENTVKNVCRLLVENGCADTRYKIIRYRPMGVRGEYKHFTPPTDELMKSLADTARGFGLTDVLIV